MDNNIVLILLAIVFIATIVYISLQNYFEGATSFKYNTNLIQLSQIDLTGVRDPSSSNFSYGMWLKLPKFKDGIIYNRETELKIFIKNGALMASCVSTSLDVDNTVTSTTNEFELIKNLPLQKWMYINISISKIKDSRSIVDVYIDGKLIKSLQYNGLIVPSTNTAEIGPSNAKLVGFKRWSYSLTPVMVANEYNSMNVSKILGNYSADISVLTNGAVTNNFTIL